MEKNNGKIIAIVALAVAVVALSVGFAAFTDSLTIDGNATIKGGNNDVFAGSFQYAASPAPACVYTGGSTATNSNPGSASGNTWSGITIELSPDHPSVTCTATISNTSAYNANLTGITASGNVTCAAAAAGGATNAAAICATVEEEVQIGSAANNMVVTTTGATPAASFNQAVAKTNGTTTATVIVSYDTEAGVPDGDITVTLPTITHSYTTVQ